MKILFFGTAGVAVPFLRRLVETEQVVGAVSQPDRPAERGYQLRPTAVKALAVEKGIPVFQPEKYTPEVVEQLTALGAELSVVVSYGKIIPPAVFSLTPLGCFNVHFSLLPKYRGAAPVQWAVIRGETETGVSTFCLEKGLDTGPLLVQKRFPVADSDDAAALMEKLIALGVEVMDETIALIRREGGCKGVPQQGEPTYAPVLSKDTGRIDWSAPARTIFDLVRGTKPWPGTFTVIGEGKMQGKRLKVLKAEPADPSLNAGGGGEPGRITAAVKNRGFLVRCGDGNLLVEEVQPENKKAMPAWSFLQGGYMQVGSRFS